MTDTTSTEPRPERESRALLSRFALIAKLGYRRPAARGPDRSALTQAQVGSLQRACSSSFFRVAVVE